MIERSDLYTRCGLPPYTDLDDGDGVPWDLDEPPVMDEVTRSQLLVLMSELVETRDVTGCPKVAANVKALGLILTRHEPNGIG
ncbi:hypothetical protein [Halomonas sp. H10-9-1]|uniref:hypothetical protein n=1 Tax=Halomonas sp. H10-9-1 TaxID=2950871 RepID=UPI0032DEF0C8